MPTYEVTCSFDEGSPDDPERAMARSRETLRRMAENDVEIDQQAVRLRRRDADVTRLELRYSASTEGVVGWHAYRAQLPVGGIRRLE